jgi:protein phosphatase
MKAIAPTRVFIIRGNHEFQGVCNEGGFLTQVIEAFGTAPIYQTALAAFAWTPLAAVIDGTILCVHGGLSPDLDFLQQIRCITRPITEWGDDITEGLLWSDPDSQVKGFERSSKRRVGFLFGERPTAEFLDRNHLKLLVRGHECVAHGWQERFDGRLLTVFSASNYCGSVGNDGAVVVLGNGGELKKVRFTPLPWRRRSDVVARSIMHSGSSAAQCKFLCPTQSAEGSLGRLVNVRSGSLRASPSASLGRLICRMPAGPPTDRVDPGDARSRSGVLTVMRPTMPRLLATLKEDSGEMEELV